MRKYKVGDIIRVDPTKVPRVVADMKLFQNDLLIYKLGGVWFDSTPIYYVHPTDRESERTFVLENEILKKTIDEI